MTECKDYFSLGGIVVSTSDCGAGGRGFKSRHRQIFFFRLLFVNNCNANQWIEEKEETEMI